MAPAPLDIVVVYNTTNQYGLAKDAENIAQGFAKIWQRVNQPIHKVRVMDPREPPIKCDVCIHLEVPYAAWFPWARCNVLLVNPEWYYDAWNCYKDNFDFYLFKTPETCRTFVDAGICREENALVLHMLGASSYPKESYLKSVKHEDGFVWFCGGSKNKIEAATQLLPLWKDSYGPLKVYVSEKGGLNISSMTLSPVVSIEKTYLDDKKWLQEMHKYPGHIGCSSSEGFGYSMEEASMVRAFKLMNRLDAYTHYYANDAGCAFVDLPMVQKGLASYVNWSACTTEQIQGQLDIAIDAFRKCDLQTLRNENEKTYKEGWKKNYETSLEAFFQTVIAYLKTKSPLPKFMPPVLNASDCPPISVVTLVYNRPKFIENAFLNLLSSDYPRDKIEWVVVDDSDATESPCNKVIQFIDKFRPGSITYVPLDKKTPIGEKRNIGVQRSTNDIILMMDDDDVFPSTSFRRRVGWLLHRQQTVVCTILPMYDLFKGTSVVSVPPYNLCLAQRISESTLTFYKSFWEEKKFPEKSIGEGEEFLAGRESRVTEIPSFQIIVALQHDKNASARIVPAEAKPGCAWGFEKPHIYFLHSLVGVGIEEVK